MQLCAAASVASIVSAAAAIVRKIVPFVSIPASLRCGCGHRKRPRRAGPDGLRKDFGRIYPGCARGRRMAGGLGRIAMDAAAPAPSVFSFGRAELDEQRRELRVDGRPVALETKPYELLRVFLHHPGETLSKDELIEAIWPGRVVTEGVLAKCVTKLRS